MDAFALRHHVAETLLRFFYVVLHHSEGASYWVELVDTPTANDDVIKQNHAAVERSGDRDELLRTVFLPPGVTTLEATERGADDARSPGTSFDGDDVHEVEDLTSRVLSTHIAWINYAVALLMQQSPDLNAAHNKLEHGMGLRPQDDVLTTLTTTPPSVGGELPLGALTGDSAINLFDGVTTEFLARKSRRHGLEATSSSWRPRQPWPKQPRWRIRWHCCSTRRHSSTSVIASRRKVAASPSIRIPTRRAPAGGLAIRAALCAAVSVDDTAPGPGCKQGSALLDGRRNPDSDLR